MGVDLSETPSKGRLSASRKERKAKGKGREGERGDETRRELTKHEPFLLGRFRQRGPHEIVHRAQGGGGREGAFDLGSVGEFDANFGLLTAKGRRWVQLSSLFLPPPSFSSPSPSHPPPTS